MSTLLTPESATYAAPVTRPFNRTLATWVAILSLVVGFGSVLGGIVGAWYTYDQAAIQNITTPSDAVIPDTPVRGPVSMWSQIDIINYHQLDRTGGLYYAEMDRMVPQIDEDGQPVLENGAPVMVPNQVRLSWLDATTLTTTLSMGILAYAMAAFAVAVGAVLVLNGFFVLGLRPAKT
jgi:hypothetical protein